MAVRAFKLPTTSGAVGPEGNSADGTVRYFGHSEIRETGGAAVVGRIHDGDAATGATLATFSLAANGSVPAAWFGPTGIAGSVGLYVEIVSGTGIIEGSVFIG